MKKLITLFAVIVPAFGFSQTDTLLYENFDIDPTAAYALVSSGTDTGWVDYDVDNLPDGSGNARPGNWFWDVGFGTNDSTGCMVANSWFSSAGKALNYLILPPLVISDTNAMLYWRSAPYQTPLFLDGYKVVVSTTDNFETSFTDTLFEAAEYIDWPGSDSSFANFTFSNGFIHGLDGSYVEYLGDSIRLLGDLRPFSASLAAYSGQTIYICFLHDSYDDNLVSVDDILVTGTLTTGIVNTVVENKLSVSPNPVANSLRVEYVLPATSQVNANIYDEKGALIRTLDKGLQIAGNQQININVSDLATGKYFVQVVAGKKFMKSAFIVSR